MARDKWDGNFREAYWVSRDNPVEELIENNGRILREPTPDGYTHDIVYRAGYVSEDYYFPNPDRSNGHDHYEMHSDGTLLKNGRKIIHNGGKNSMKHMRMRNISNIDGTKIDNEAREKEAEAKRLQELGQEFLKDKAKLEKNIELIENDPTLDRAHKIQQLRALRAAVEKLQEDYEKRVTDPQKEVQDEIKRIIIIIIEAEEKLEEQAELHRGVQMDVAATDTSAAAEAAEAEKQKFREMHERNVEELNLRMQQQQLQRQEIMKKMLSGR